MSKNWGLMAWCIAMLCSPGLYAQKKVLGLEEMFRLADEQSRSMRVYELGMLAAEEGVKAAKAARLPEVGVSASVSYWGDGRLWNWDFGQGMRVDMPHFGNNFALEARQVIYAGGAVDNGIERATLGKGAAGLDWQKNRQEVRFLLAGYYLDLCRLDNEVRVLEQNLELAEAMIANMKARREQGVALKNDITRYELQREMLLLQLARTEDAVKIINHQLVNTLHLPEGTWVVPDTALLAVQVQALDERTWQEAARGSHLGLQQAQVGVRASEQEVKAVRAARLPEVVMTAADHLDGPITIEVPVLDNNFNYWQVGIRVSYNLSSLFRDNRRLRQAKLQVNQAQERYALAQEEVDNAVQAGYVNLRTAFTELRTQEKSVLLASEHYEVVSSRYAHELALLTDLLDAANMKLSAELGLVNARISVLYHYYQMRYITHTL